MLITEPETERETARSDQTHHGPLNGWEWLGLGGLILVAGILRLWKLDQNGIGNMYYAAAVRSMLASWNNFFFGSFDPLGFVTVDKPPGGVWIQAISAKLFGYRGTSLLMPQALMGVASAGLTYHLVRRAFGGVAALIAGLAVAMTPIGVAVDRDNLPDSALVFVLLLSAWALVRAVESGKIVPLLVCAALVGVGFNIKMLAAYVVLPTFYAGYFLAAQASWKSKLVNLTAATLVLAAVSLSWAIAVELTPKSRRPYIGGSTNNSAIELALGYNGLGRVFGGRGNMGPPPGMGGPRGARPFDAPAVKKATAPKSDPKSEPPPDDPAMAFGPGMGFPPGGPPPFGGPGGGMPGFGGTPGLLRFSSPLMSSQITWLFPIAILGAAVAALRVPLRLPLGPEHFGLFLWGGWLATHWVVFSFAQGIFHEYYSVIMGPAVAALAGIGAAALYQDWQRQEGRGYLPTALILTACWEAYIIQQSPMMKRWLFPAIGVGTLLSVVGLIAGRRLQRRRGSETLVKLATLLGIATILLGPGVWSLAPAVAEGNGVMPAARISSLTGEQLDAGGFPPMPPIDRASNQKLLAFLKANHHGEAILVAAPSSMEVSPIIINEGENAVSLGGFMGSDPVVTKDEFAAMVTNGKVRFVMSGGGPGGGMGPPGMGPPGMGPPGMGPLGGRGNAELMAWVREHGEEVDPALWKEDEKVDEPFSGAPDPAADSGPMFNPSAMFRRMRRMGKLYDCRPERGLAAVASEPDSTNANH